MYRRLTHYSIIVGMICLLSACGFQLRGAGTGGTALPEAWKSMYLVTNNPNSEFTRDVSALFSATGVIWAEDRVSANFTPGVTTGAFLNNAICLSIPKLGLLNMS